MISDTREFIKQRTDTLETSLSDDDDDDDDFFVIDPHTQQQVLLTIAPTHTPTTSPTTTCPCTSSLPLKPLLNTNNNKNDNDHNDHKNKDANTQTTHTQNSFNSHDIHTHYVILSHGWLGKPKEMSYIQQAIQNNIAITKNKNNNDNIANDNYIDNQSCNDNNVISSSRVIVHSATCNHKRTHDGIANGGKRLAHEIQEFIQNDISASFFESFISSSNDNYNNNYNNNHNTNHGHNSHVHVSLSIVGYSLGGLYSRYALSCLPKQLSTSVVNKNNKNNDDNNNNNNNTATTKNVINIILHYNIFITTASPHLGCANHTYMNIPRFLETIFGKMCRNTGKDLFSITKKKKKTTKNVNSNTTRDDDGNPKDVVAAEEEFDNLIFEMGTNYETFLRPLSQFRKRVAYINAFHTDFQVPTTTAAFLSNDSSYPHTILTNHKNHSDNNHNQTQCDCSFVVATVKSEMNDSILTSKVNTSCQNKYVQDLIMSNKLDSLGWDKIFIDSRAMNPIPSIPKRIFMNRSRLTTNSSERKNNIAAHRLGFETYYQKDNFKDYDDIHFDSNRRISAIDTTTKRSNISDCTATTGSFSDDSNTSSNSNSITSRDVNLYMTSRNAKIHIPVGHCMLIANSKSKSSAKFYSRGRPIVDVLARSLVNDLPF